MRRCRILPAANGTAAPTRSLTLRLSALFLLSGASGLVYQVVWLRMLTRSFGVTVHAVTTVVAIFMGGLAIGSLLAGRLARGRSALRVYGVIELLIALSAALSTPLMLVTPDLFRSIVAMAGAHAAVVVAVRALAAAVLLLPSTILMGATLPVLSSYLTSEAKTLGRQAGLLYGMNTLGAVVGVLGAGFYLLGELGEKRTIGVAIALNAAVGVACLWLSRGARSASTTAVLEAAEQETPAPETPAPEAPEPEAPAPEAPATAEGDSELTPAHVRLVLIAYAVSGAAALALEVLWSRVLSVVVGNSVYGFSLVLAAYLAGIAAGAVLMVRYVERIRSPLLVLGLLETGAAFLSLASLHVLVSVPQGSDPRYSYSQIWGLGDFARIGFWSVMIVLPVMFLNGAIFPLATRIVSQGSKTPAASIGKLYGYNTVGGIVGSIAAGFVLIPVLGTLLSFVLTSLVVVLVGARLVWAGRTAATAARVRMVGLLSILGFLVLAVLSFDDPFLRLLQARVHSPPNRLVANVEDRGATVTMFQSAESQNFLFINGLFVSNTASGIGEQMLNVPLVFQGGTDPRNIMLAGFGVGESFTYGIKAGHRVTVAELQPAVVDLYRQVNPDGPALLASPNARVVINDARNHLLSTDERYDLVLVDVSPPLYASGMVNLYSAEFFRLVRAHLTDRGTFVLWFPMICFEDDFWMVLRNFADTFESLQALTSPGMSNAMLIGAPGTGRFALPDDAHIEGLLRRWEPDPLYSARWIRAALGLDEAGLRRNALRYPAVTDDRPGTEFPFMRFVRGERYYGDNQFLYKNAPDWVRR